MMTRKDFLAILALLVPAAKIMSQNPQQRHVSDGCDGCELIYEELPQALTNTTYLPDWYEDNDKMVVEGKIFKRDGVTPAVGIILYIYHTDSKGLYSKGASQKLGIRHGHIRGWIKTGEDGSYRFYTCKPAPYPERNSASHIHPVIKEPGTNEYYIDNYVFEGDPLLTAAERKKMQNRGGSGIVKLTRNSKGWLVAKRDIILGLNIPNYG